MGTRADRGRAIDASIRGVEGSCGAREWRAVAFDALLAEYMQTMYGVSLTGSAGQETFPIDAAITPRVRSGTDSLADERV